MEEKKSLIASQNAGVRLDVFLRSQEPGFSRTCIQDLILSKKVFVNGAAVKAHYKLRVDDDVCWQAPEVLAATVDPEEIPLDIMHEDHDIIVLNKPSGMVVHPGAGNREHTLVNALLFHTRELSTLSPERPGIVHRLDKETSGVMVVAKNNAAHLNLSRQFKKHTIERRYIALVEGGVPFDEGVIDAPIKRHALDRKKMAVSFSEEAKGAHTVYKVLKRFPDYTSVALFPQTGRTHQLRVHLSFLGHPVLGDRTYGKAKSFARLALHAMVLGFTHPFTGKFIKFTSPLPPEMKAAMPGVKIT
jgi:23S rRNA pseudouridine1911/1915/1917 synthase